MAEPPSPPSRAPDEPRHDAYAALRHSDFRRLLLGSILAKVGYEMQAVAVGWELYRRTGSPLALGLVGLVQVVPVILLSLPAGQAADRFSRRAILIGSQAVLVACSLGLTTISATRAPVAAVYLCLGSAGAAMAIGNPSRWALLPQIVPAKDFANAVAWRTSVWQVSNVVGPALGGLVLAFGARGTEAALPAWADFLAVDRFPAWLRGATLVYAADAFLGFGVVLIYIRLRPGPRPQGRREPLTATSLLAGVRFVFSTRMILAAITLDMFAVLLGGATTLLPIFAEDVLDVGEVGFGWLRAAPSIGAVVMALVLAHRPPLRKAGRALLLSVVGFGFAMLVFGLSRSPMLSFVALMASGALDNVSMVVRGTLVQLTTPDAMRGRVSAVNGIFIGMSNELGGFESGVTAEWLGPVGSVVLGGLGCIVVVGVVAARWPEIARLGRLEDLEPALMPVAAGPASSDGGAAP